MRRLRTSSLRGKLKPSSVVDVWTWSKQKESAGVTLFREYSNSLTRVNWEKIWPYISWSMLRKIKNSSLNYCKLYTPTWANAPLHAQWDSARWTMEESKSKRRTEPVASVLRTIQITNLKGQRRLSIYLLFRYRERRGFRGRGRRYIRRQFQEAALQGAKQCNQTYSSDESLGLYMVWDSSSYALMVIFLQENESKPGSQWDLSPENWHTQRSDMSSWKKEALAYNMSLWKIWFLSRRYLFWSWNRP